MLQRIMLKSPLSFFILLQMPAFVWAQGDYLLSSSQTTLTMKFQAEASSIPKSIQKDISMIPFFAHQPKSVEQQLEDLAFISSCENNFGSRVNASAFFCQMGWQYLSEGSKELATQRFNLAWLLNRHNPEAHWGLGVILFQNNELQSANASILKAAELAPQHPAIHTDLATLLLERFLAEENVQFLFQARDTLLKVIEQFPHWATAHVQLASTYLHLGESVLAWEAFHKGYALSPSEVDFDLVDKLLHHADDPKGIFSLPNKNEKDY